jgi:5'(3')-deoxyribonucleotidase
MDGVLVDFQSGIDSLSDNEKEIYEGRYDEVPGIFSKMIPKDGALKAFEKLSNSFEVYILSTAPWDNPSAWTDKLLWVKKYLGTQAHKKLILSHNKHLNAGDFLIDDRIANGADRFRGEHIHFNSEDHPQFKDWNGVLDYILALV